MLRDSEIPVYEYDKERYSQTKNEIKNVYDKYKEKSHIVKAQIIAENLAKNLGVLNKELKNNDAEISFEYSKNQVGESIHNQHLINGFGGMNKNYKLLTCLEEVSKNAIPVLVEKDRYVDTYRENDQLVKVYNFVGAYYDKGVVPVVLTVKEYLTATNGLYVAVAADEINIDNKKRDTHLGVANTNISNDIKVDLRPRAPLFNVSLIDIVKEVKQGEFTRLFPDELLNEQQKKAKQNAIKKEEIKYNNLYFDDRSIKKRDNKYFNLIKKGNIEAAQEMVDRLATESSPMLRAKLSKE